MSTIVEEAERLATTAAKCAAHIDGWILPARLPSDILFMAWITAQKREWEQVEKRLDPHLVSLAKAAGGEHAEQLVYRNPLTYCQTQHGETGRRWQCAGFYYDVQPLWYAAYYQDIERIVHSKGAPA